MPNLVENSEFWFWIKAKGLPLLYGQTFQHLSLWFLSITTQIHTFVNVIHSETQEAGLASQLSPEAVDPPLRPTEHNSCNIKRRSFCEVW
jgi:hypothetical protein